MSEASATIDADGAPVAADVRLKRAYDPPEREDGRRILIDRLWPRGVSKADATIDLWLKELAPSTELRKWFGHDPRRWAAFRTRYAKEIHGKGELLEHLRELARWGPVTLVYSARDQTHNDAIVLRDVLLGHGPGTAEGE
jgi:uncharacterized protein YeaO (DUF488 family)